LRSLILRAAIVQDREQPALLVPNDREFGGPDDPATEMGPMANARRIEAMQRLTKDAVDRGARIEAGGARLDRPGFYWPPTILTNVPPDAKVLHEEPLVQF
jgi:succinate-semialdehyde dehydrogenase/glutarate-semialdehyde dehydrogenase